MRFLLDNDTDVAVGRVLRQAGHDCQLPAGSGLTRVSDPEMAVFADDRRMVVLSHDLEFLTWRRKNTFGQHVHLDCLKWEAAAIVGEHLDALVEILRGRDPVIMKLGKDGGPKAYRDRWI